MSAVEVFGPQWTARLAEELNADAGYRLAIDRRMNTLAPTALGVIREIFAAYDEIPFGLQQEEFSGFALSQFQKRYARIDKARGSTLEEVERAHPEDGRVNETPSGELS
ncbi:MAG: hypothetical protein GY769_18885 [bacterium]|nr:hypothetical protein [bacterium]